MTEQEQARLEFAERQSAELVERYFEQERKIKDLYKQIADADAKREREVEKAVKAAKFDATVSAVISVCDTIDECLGFHAFEYTDRIRKVYKIPTKYGY